MVKLIRFTTGTKLKTPVMINPDAVAAITEDSGKTTIFLRAPTVNAHGLQFTVHEDIDTVTEALTR